MYSLKGDANTIVVVHAVIRFNTISNRGPCCDKPRPINH